MDGGQINGGDITGRFGEDDASVPASDGPQNEEEAIECARREIALLLPDKESLKNVAQLKKDHARIKSHLDSQIQRILQKKIEEAEEWVRLLKDSVGHIAAIEKDFADIEAECEICNQRVHDWQTVKKFNQARNNVMSALSELQLLRSLPSELEEVRDMMDDDEIRDEQLLDIHCRLVKLEETRARVISKHRRREVELPDTHHLMRSFESVGDLVHGFEEVTCDHLVNALDLAQEAPSVLVRILRVIERQERIDRWWRQEAAQEKRAFEQLQQSGLEPAEIGSQLGYTPLRLRDKAKSWMQTGVENRFHEMISELYESEGDVTNATLDKMTKLRDELVIIYDDVAPCFPPVYEAFTTYIGHYHRKFRQIFEMLADRGNEGRLPAGVSLNLINWIEDYRDVLESLGMMEPPIPTLVSLTSFEAALVDSHERMFNQNLETLSLRILDDDWSEKHAQADEEHHERCSTRAPALFFRLLRESASRIFDLPRFESALHMSSQAGIAIHKFQDAVFSKMTKFNEESIKVDSIATQFRSSHKNSNLDAEAEAKAGDHDANVEDKHRQLKHFAFAWLNNCQDLHDFTVNLQDHLNSNLEDLYDRVQLLHDLNGYQTGEKQITSSHRTVDFENIAEGFLQIGVQFATMVGDLLWRDLQPLCEQLFVDDGTRADDVVYLLSSLLTNDLRYRVGHTFSERVGRDLLERWLLAYWDKLLSKDGFVEKMKEPQLGDDPASCMLTQDFLVMQEFREAVKAHKDNSDDEDDMYEEPSMTRVVCTLERITQIWDFLHQMLTIEPVVERLYLGFQNICSRDASCPTTLCELILVRRHKDVSSKIRKQVMSMFKDRTVHFKTTGILCRLVSLQSVDDVLKKEALRVAEEKAAAEGAYAFCSCTRPQSAHLHNLFLCSYFDPLFLCANILCVGWNFASEAARHGT